MNQKILTQDELLEKGNISADFLEKLLDYKLILPKGKTEDNLLVFREMDLLRIEEVQKFIGMGYSLEEVAKIAKKVGLPSTKKNLQNQKQIKYLTVGELADKIGLNPRTIKYWEERGIIEPDSRSGGGFRLYAEHWVYLCQLIQDLQLFGYSLDEIKQIADLVRLFIAAKNRENDIDSDELHNQILVMKTKIKEFYEKLNKFKKGIERWEELIKKKEREIREIENYAKNKTQKADERKKKS